MLYKIFVILIASVGVLWSCVVVKEARVNVCRIFVNSGTEIVINLLRHQERDFIVNIEFIGEMEDGVQKFLSF